MLIFRNVETRKKNCTKVISGFEASHEDTLFESIS